MLNNELQTTSFPFLGNNTNDYRKTKFEINVKTAKSQTQLQVIVRYTLANIELQQLILDKKIIAIATFDCPSMSIHKASKIPFDSCSVSFYENKMNLDNQIDICVHLVAAEDLNYSNKDLSEEWDEDFYFIQKNNEIGMTNVEVLRIEHKDLGKKSSIFHFTENTSLDVLEPVTYSLNNDTIEFVMPHQTYINFNSVQYKKPEAVLVSLIVPVLTDILRQIIEDPNDEVENAFNALHENKKWYQVISEKYEKIFGRSPKECADPFKDAQYLVTKPMYGFLHDIKRLVNMSEEEK